MLPLRLILEAAGLVLDALSIAGWVRNCYKRIHMSKAIGIWKIMIPKERVIELLNRLDADQDGYISGAEIRTAVKDYLRAVKNSKRFFIPGKK